MSGSNPLKAYTRTPKIYVKLPTLGRFYDPELLTLSVTHEAAVRASTARDDLIVNNPDALLNGDAVFEVVQSCIDVKNSRELLLPDVQAILLGIRYASKGDALKFQVTCPKCNTVNEEQLSIRALLDATVTIDDIEEEPFHEMSKTETSLVRVNIHPSPYTDITASNIVSFEQARMFSFFENNPDVPLEERNARVRDSFERLSNFHLNILLNSIESVDIVDIVDGEEVITKVTDKKHIEEFVADISSEDADEIQRKLGVFNDIGVPSSIGIVCEAVHDDVPCNHSYEMEVKFDPSNFSADILPASVAQKS